MGISATIGQNSYAFYAGGSASSQVIPMSVMLNDRTYAIDLAQYRRMSQETLRDSMVQSQEPSDALFNASGAWSRYQYSWFHGADQEFADLRNDADPYRFDTSQGVYVWDDHELTLLPRLDQVRVTVSTNPILCVSGAYLFVGDGTALYRTTDLVTFTTCTAPGGTIQAMTTDGTDLYVATSTVMKKYAGTSTSPTAFATPVTGNCSNVAFVANRLLMSQDNVLYEVAAAGTLTTIRTHYQAAFEWTTIFAVGSRIYIGGYSGTRSELYSLAVNDSGSLVQAQDVAPFPAGELLQTGLSYAGAILLGTSKGVRFAQLGSDSTLTYGPLIDAPVNVKTIAADGRFAWTNWAADAYGNLGTARLALDTFVDVLQPAYARDLETSTPDPYVTLSDSNAASHPAIAALDVLGDLQITTIASFENAWINKVLCSVWEGASSRQYEWVVDASGYMRLETSPDGTYASRKTATATATMASLSLNPYEKYYFKVTYDVDDGAGNRVTKFWYAPYGASVPTTWTQIGATVTQVGTTSIAAGSARLFIGKAPSGTLTGAALSVWWLEVCSGIDGTPVFEVDFTTGGAGTVVTESINAGVVTLTGTPTWTAGTYAFSSITSVARFLDRTVIAGPNNTYPSDGGVFAESQSSYVETGYVTSGLITFGTVEPKILTDLKASCIALVSGESIQFEIAEHGVADEPVLCAAGGSSVASTSSFTVDLDGCESGEQFRVTTTLAGNGSSTPTLQKWRLRGYPVAPPVMNFVVPILLFGTVTINTGEGQDYAVNQLEEYEALESLWRSKRAVTYREGDRAYRVRVDAFELQPYKWTDVGDFFDSTLILRLVEV